jgi:hypothetical protein
MASEIDRIYLSQRNPQIGNMTNYYVQRTHKSTETYVGFVSFKQVHNNLAHRYNVTVPGLNNATLTNVPVQVADALAFSNGVGSQVGLRPGQAVTISFDQGTSNYPVITSARYIIGDSSKYRKGDFPRVDESDEETGNAIMPPPNSSTFLSAGGEAASTVYPYLIRTNSPVHGEKSPAAIEIPGSTITHDYFGNMSEVIVGQKIHTALEGEVHTVKGARESLANSSVNKALLAKENMLRYLKEQSPLFYSTANGVFQPVDKHPASPDLRLQTSGTQAVRTVNQVLDVIESFNSLATKTGILSQEQVSFLKSHLFKYSQEVKLAWGIVGGLGLGDVIDQVLPTNTISSVLQTVQTTVTKLYQLAQVLNLPVPELPDTNLSIIVGGGSGAPTPLSSEATLIAAGIKALQDLTQELGSADKLSAFSVVSSIKNNLDFVADSSDALASFLSDLGVQRASDIVLNTLQFIETNSIQNLLEIAQNFTPTAGQAALALASTYFGQSRPAAVERMERIVNKVSLRGCPVLPRDLERAFHNAHRQDLDAVLQVFDEILYVSPTDFTKWVVNLDDLLDWLDQFPGSIKQAIKQLLDGKIVDFLVSTVSLHTGVNVRRFPRHYARLQVYTRKCFKTYIPRYSKFQLYGT